MATGWLIFTALIVFALVDKRNPSRVCLRARAGRCCGPEPSQREDTFLTSFIPAAP
jgi:hypothetical protein